LSPKTFIKSYKQNGQILDLPANSYWLLREDSILSYLNQRGARVPKVLLKNIEDQSITLEYVGESFEQLFLYSKNESSTSLFKCILSAASELLKIFELGVLHLDIAARNLTRKNAVINDIYILDFAHSISSNYSLQKPIPLLPQSQKQHPYLVDALKADWNLFFTQSKIQIPNLDEKFEVDNQLFSDYWIEHLAVQNLQGSYAVLSHGLGQLLLEMSSSHIISRDDRIYLINLGQNLCYIENKAAEISIENALIDLKLYSEKLSSLSNNSITEIPIVTNLQNIDASNNYAELNQPIEVNNNQKLIVDDHPVPILTKPNNFDLLKKDISTHNSVFFKSENTQTVQLPFENTRHALALTSLTWFFLICHIFWLDFIIREIRLQLSNWLLYTIFGFAFLMATLVLATILNGRIRKAFMLDFPSLFLICQIIVTGFVSTKTQWHPLIWAPSSIVFLFIAVLIYQNKKCRINFYSAQ
jgi:tRNA A-37 threonylcarbamoyl transferase component Bud32